MDTRWYVPAHVVMTVADVWNAGGPSFSKSVKLGQVDVEIQSMEVNYSKNTMKCSIKFEVDAPEAGYCRGPSGRSIGWMAMF